MYVVMYAYCKCELLKITFPHKQLITLTRIVQYCNSFCFLVPFWRYHEEGDWCSGVRGYFAAVFFNARYLALFVRFYFSASSALGEEVRMRRST